VGLSRDGRLDLAQDMVTTLFEVEHYGAVLNANRTYYLTRSQPPFLDLDVLGVYAAQKAAGHGGPRLADQGPSNWLSRITACWDASRTLPNPRSFALFDLATARTRGVQDETGHYRELWPTFSLIPEQDRNLQ